MTTTNPATAPLFTFPIAAKNAADDDLPVHWVQDETALYQLIDEIDSVDVVALDTEFIKRSTFYPILALVQVNTGKAIYLVDAPKLDLLEFWQALSEVPTMVWYACGEDLGIFYLLSGLPPLNNVFDVQIAIAYLTGNLHIGYSHTVSEVLGITLDKGESQSNWLARPLTHEQTVYAQNDVRYLLTLYHAVKDALNAKNILHCVVEDCAHYAKSLHQIQHTPDDALYLDLIAPNYDRRQLGVLQTLTAWREALARATNEPRSFIIGKQALREIVLEMPDSIKLLARTTINRAALRRYGDEIVRLIRQVKAASEHELPPLPPPSYHSKDKPFKNALNTAVQNFSEHTHIPANLLLKNRWMNDLLLLTAYPDKYSFDDLPDELHGYRKAWIVDQILPILSTYKAHILQVLETPEYPR